uniref:Ribonuclease E n=1 Tax=Eucheuma denticulatum TaxID=305493 RepID=A0A8E7UEL4_9FLOR|nr:ribonuclease E [Eucheuma denticulatum]
MTKKIIISRFNNIAAILQNSKIQEIIVIQNTYQVNDIYIGIVEKIFSGINAAFIKLSKNGRSGFIHISDLKHLKKNRHINNINDILSINQLLLVQIIKEPTMHKGPRLTTNINLLGRYIVLMPFCNTIYISYKIYDENERIYLHSLAILLKPSTMGLIIRSSAQGAPIKAIIEDLDSLNKQWNFIEKIALSSSFPCLIYKEKDLIKRIIRDNYDNHINNIIIDSENGLKQIQYHLNRWNCIEPVKIQIHKTHECILEQFDVKQTILKALKAHVKLASGGHLSIESHEALTVIDVNSGSFNKSDNSKETILRTNFYAAIEIAHQLRIRNINGVIIIDFIDMLSQQDQLQLLEHFGKLLKLDNAKPQIVQLSALGLVELTRRRRGQSLQEIFYSKNHSYVNLRSYRSLRLDYQLTKTKELHDLSLNKSIKSLFFSKKFTKVIELREGYLENQKNLNDRNFVYLNKKNIIYFLNLRKNYIVPFIVYLEIFNMK